MTTINPMIRGGKYQPISTYEMISGGNAGYARPAASVYESRAHVEASLVAAGFVQTAQPGGNWVHLRDKLQAHVCVDCPIGMAPAGETVAGTIGVEIWDDQNVEQLV